MQRKTQCGTMEERGVAQWKKWCGAVEGAVQCSERRDAVQWNKCPATIKGTSSRWGVGY